MRDADLEPTGRELKDPAATLVECVDSDNLKHTVISFDEAYRGHPSLSTSVDLIMSFLAYPMVTGLVECSAADTKRARFAYPTGTIWTVKEVMRGFDQVNQAVGPRAAVELMYLSGMILHEAGETGPLQGCFSHGNLNPWRIGLKADGQVQVFGYGLAQVEMVHFVHGDGEHVGHDSIRYAPPERLEGQPEQPSSDTYSLAAMAVELITGKPLYDHKEPQKLWDSVKLAEGVQRVRAEKKIPKNLRTLLSEALIYDPDKRLQGMDLVNAAGDMLDDPKLEGRTLLAVMERMLNTGTRSSRKLVKAATSVFSMDDLKAMAEADDDDEDDGASAGPESRWGSVTREGTTGRGGRRPGTKTTADHPRKRAGTKKPVAATKDAPAEEAPRRRRKRRGTSVAEPDAGVKQEEVPQKATKKPDPKAVDPKAADPKAAEPVEEAAAADEKPEPRRRRRSKRKEQAAPAPEAAVETSTPIASAPDGEDAEDEPRRRRRTQTQEAPPEQEVASPRRRRRRPDAATGEEPPPTEPPRRRRRRTDTEEETKEEEPAETPRRRRRRKPDEK